jgi:hypothetical protein
MIATTKTFLLVKILAIEASMLKTQNWHAFWNRADL